ncbi:MAG: tetratricopeptide repeat protein [Candidatus Scalindua sp.]
MVKKMLGLIERKLSVNANDAIALSRAATYKAHLGDKISASNAIKRVLEIAPNDGLALYNCVCTYAQLGKKEEAIELLQKAIIIASKPTEHSAIGYKNIIQWIENDPDLDNIRNEPEFIELIKGK